MDMLKEIQKYTDTLSLLYIDNNLESRISTASCIENLVKQFVVTSTAEDGLELYKSNFLENNKHYDIVLIDIDMPNMSTLEMCKLIKNEKKNQIIAIIVSATDTEYFQGALDIGIDKCIIKPIIDPNSITADMIDLSRKVKLQNELEKQTFLLHQQNNIINSNIYMTTSDLNGIIIDVSQAYLDFTAYTREEVIGQNHSVFRNQDIESSVIKNLWETILQDKVWQGTLKNNKSSGEEYWIHTVITPLYDNNNKKIGYTSIKKDITNEKRLEELSTKDSLTLLDNRKHFDYFIKRELKRSTWKKEFFSLFILSIDFYEEYLKIYGQSEADKVVLQISKELDQYLNSNIGRIFKISESEFAIILINHDDIHIENFANELLIQIESLKIPNTQSKVFNYFTLSIGAVNLDTAKYSLNSDDLYNIADSNLNKVKNQGGNNSLMEITNKSIKDLENLDTITKLPNRGALIHDLIGLEDEAMVVLLHINQIKSLKDLYGFNFAHKVISQKSEELKNIIQNEEATLYNLNFQEFAILITNKSLFEKYLLLLEHSILTHNESYENSRQKHIVADFTAGIAYGTRNILNHADLVLQEAIISNVKYKIYRNNQSAKQLQEDNLERLKIYKHALHAGNIIPYFQPIIDASNDKVVKYEALARLETQEGEIISPYYFLDAAKEDKTFEYFTRQMMQKVFNIYAKNNVPISLNLSYENIHSEEMVKYIKNRLDKYGGNGITFEIVESEDILDYAIIEKFILMVKAYGCKISIDDFGSGYSNFTNIIKLDIDYIKLDGSLIQQLNTDANVKLMIQGLIVYCKNANIYTVAEFVSDKELATTVKSMGIDYIQGYYYGEPQPPEYYKLT